MLRQQRFYSIQEVEKLVLKQSQQIKKLSRTIGISKNSIIREVKKQMTLCTSLGIVFLEYSLLSTSLKQLRLAVSSESALLRDGTIIDTLWEGRVVLYNTLSFLYQRAGQFKDALQYVYKSHKLSLQFRDAGGTPSLDILLASALTSFIVLWKIQKFKEASGYLETSASIVNDIYKKGKPSQLSVSSMKNLYGIVLMSLAGLLIKIKHEHETALLMCEEGLSQLPPQNIVRKMIERFLSHIKINSRAPSVALSSADMASNFSEHSSPPDLYEHRNPMNDWLITEEYEEIIFISLFVMHISPNTPLIKKQELESNKHKKGTMDFDKVKVEKIKELRFRSEPRKRLNVSKGLPPLDVNTIKTKRNATPSVLRPSATRRMPTMQEKARPYKKKLYSNAGVMPVYHCIDPTTGFIESVLN